MLARKLEVTICDLKEIFGAAAWLTSAFIVATIIKQKKMLRLEFDPNKDAANIAKHGVSLVLAESLDWDAALVWVDERFEYDEMRMIALAPESNTLYYVAFVDRMDEQGIEARRIISLRRATRSEVKHYVENC